jgi:hypothetical protein
MTRWRLGLGVALGIASGCGGSDDKVVAELAGGWSGSVETANGPVPVVGALAFDEDAGLLTGTFELADPGQSHTYAVRRWDVSRGVVYLDLTDVTQATRGLDLDGEVAADFSGAATVSYPCETGTCGYEGDFLLTRGEPPLTVSTPTPGDTSDTAAR